MHEGTYEDGRLAHCWGCDVDHYTTEEEPPAELVTHWRNLCENCTMDYFEGRAHGMRSYFDGRSDFERRSMLSVYKKGYMAGRFLAAAQAGRGKYAKPTAA